MQLQSQSRLSLLPRRPRGNYSQNFRSITVNTNHFHVDITSQFDEIHIFSVRINPMVPLENTTLRRQILDNSKEKLKNFIDNPVISGNNIYSFRAASSDRFEIEVGQHRIDIKEVKVLKVKENPKVLLSFLNNGLRSIMRKLNYMQIGKTGKYFNAQEKTLIDNLMMFSGYRSNFVQLEGGFYLRVDSVKKIVRNQTVLQYIDEVYRMHQDKSKQEKRVILMADLVGKIVMTNYGRTSYQRIQQVIFQDLDSVQLDDTTISIRDYYMNRYNITIKSAKQPLLRVQSRKKGGKEYMTYLVPEICLMTGIPDNFDQFRRKKISEQTIKSPEDKQREILKLMHDLRNNQQFTSLKQIGIRINKNLQSVKGKLIPMPKINLGENFAIQEGKQAFFNLFDKPIYSGKHGIRCGIIYFQGQEIRDMLDTFEKTSRNLRVKMESVKLNAGQFDSRRGIQAIDNMLQRASEKEGCNICLIVLPNQLKTQYKKVKSLALNKHKIVCQITTDGTLRKKNIQSIATKILLQIIAKRGNTLWVPKIPQGLPTTMMIAFESCKSGSKNTIAMCATINSTFSSIMSRVDSYSQLENKFSTMTKLANQSVAAYNARNKDLPKEILIFSNSISGDQIVMYIEHFIEPFKKQMGEIYGNNVPAITFVMVNTRTSQRFFTQGGNVRNVPAGTVISNDIVTEFYDFYVVSQSSNRGSTVPNHYRVIYSDSKTQEGVLQQLIFSQCFNYVNWTGSIKIPGILQYADKCAKFNSQVLENEQLTEDLQNKLYFV